MFNQNQERLVIAKFKNLKHCTYKTFNKLFNCEVLQILDYSVGVWGSKEYKKINNVEIRAMRFFLGVYKYTPILGIEGEMGWEQTSLRKYMLYAQFMEKNTMYG